MRKIFFLFIVMLTAASFGQAKKKADKATEEWR